MYVSNPELKLNQANSQTIAKPTTSYRLSNTSHQSYSYLNCKCGCLEAKTGQFYVLSLVKGIGLFTGHIYLHYYPSNYIKTN